MSKKEISRRVAARLRINAQIPLAQRRAEQRLAAATALLTAGVISIAAHTIQCAAATAPVRQLQKELKKVSPQGLTSRPFEGAF